MTKASFVPGEAAANSEPPLKRQKLSPPALSFNDTTSASTLPTTQGSKIEVVKMEESNNQTVVSDNGFQPDRELKVGILHFVNTTNPGFSGILKQRYTDFLVNEILPDGTVVHLTDDKAPPAKSIPKDNPLPEPRVVTALQPSAADVEPKSANKPDSIDASKENLYQASTLEDLVAQHISEAPKVAFTISPEDEDVLVLYFGIKLKDDLLDFHQKILSKPGAKPGSFGQLLSEPITDRVLRGRIHQDVRRMFESRIETESIEEGKIKLTAAPKSVAEQHGKNGPPIAANQMGRGRGQLGQSKGKVGWNELGGEHLHFTVYKENKDTMEILFYLASFLKVKVKDFAFAGTKDRRAATAQRVSVFRQHAKTLVRANNTLRAGTRIGNFKHEKFQLELGELAGNLFQITLRDCHFGDDTAMDDDARMQFANEIVGQAVKHIQEHGFINYFGLQRFGTFGIGTDAIGKFILQEDFESAVEAILAYSDDALAESKAPTDKVGREDIARAKAIQMFKNTAYGQQALNNLPKKFSAEAAVIRHLSMKNRSSDYCGAILMIPRNLRTMYVHAYQSLVWNMVASERWARYGSKLIEGDLILIDNQDTNGNAVKDEVDENGEIVVHPSVDDAAVQHDDIYQRARPLTAEEAESGRFSIFDIVLPTPGYDIEYPGNDIGDYYKYFMGSERGGGLDPANMRRKQKDFSLSGNYRKFLAQVGKDLSFEVKTYHEETEQLVETDLEKLLKSRPQRQAEPHRQQREQRSSQNEWYNGGRGERSARGQGTGFGRGYGGHQNNDSGRQNGNSYSAEPRASAYTDTRLSEPSPGLSKSTRASAPTEIGAAASSEMRRPESTTTIGAWHHFAATAHDNEIAAAIRKRETETPIDPDSIKQPEYQETYIETSVDDNGRRKVGKSTKMVGADGVLRDVHKEDLMTGANSSSMRDAVNTAVESEGIQSDSLAVPEPVKTVKEPATDVASMPAALAPTVPEETDSAEKVESADTSIVDEDGGVTLSPKIAVIVKFALGSSQYATMALRELMKAGGVKTYKPDFSSGR